MNSKGYLQNKINQLHELVKERQFSNIVITPTNVFLLGFLLVRSIALRLIPRITKMYFIRRSFIGQQIAIKESDYTFKVFKSCSHEIFEFAESRCTEDKRLLYQTYLKDLTERFNNAYKAFALLSGNKIVTLFFASNQKHFIEQVCYSFQPAEREIAISDIYTLKEHRNKGLYQLLINHAIKYCQSKEFETFVMWIMKHNRATIRAQQKAGFHNTFQTVNLFTWFGLKRISISKVIIPLNKL
jgi:GNAT superfamily N-acetyltransferase